MKVIFRQLFDRATCTYSYLLGDPTSREAIIIDPVYECFERDIQLIRELGLELKYTLETHVHADHVTSAFLFQKLGAQIVVPKFSDVVGMDLEVGDQEVLCIGEFKLKALSTPGHTSTCLSYMFEQMAFTGDTLMIRGCGRTDFQQGDAKVLFDSVRNTLFSLSDETLVFPAHDYKGRMHSTIGEEKRFNPRLHLDVSVSEFVKIMAQLKLDYPKLMDIAVPANLNCGKKLVA